MKKFNYKKAHEREFREAKLNPKDFTITNEFFGLKVNEDLKWVNGINSNTPKSKKVSGLEKIFRDANDKMVKLVCTIYSNGIDSCSVKELKGVEYDLSKIYEKLINHHDKYKSLVKDTNPDFEQSAMLIYNIFDRINKNIKGDN